MVIQLALYPSMMKEKYTFIGKEKLEIGPWQLQTYLHDIRECSNLPCNSECHLLIIFTVTN